jgi:hypothetical protein
MLTSSVLRLSCFLKPRNGIDHFADAVAKKFDRRRYKPRDFLSSVERSL